MEDNDYRAYIASSSEASYSEDEEDQTELGGLDDTKDASATATTDANSKTVKKSAKQSREERRAKLRELLLNNDELPEGWGNIDSKSTGSSSKPAGELEVTFTPGLSTRNEPHADDDGENETTLERYQRRQREKKEAKRLKREAKEASKTNGKARLNEGNEQTALAPVAEDDFFGEDSDAEPIPSSSSTKKKEKSRKNEAEEAAVHSSSSTPTMTEPSTKEELALLLAPENAANGPKHFDMKEVIRAEKDANKKVKNQLRWIMKREATHCG